MPEVSILMPVYNGSAFLKQAINSVLLQSFSDWELLVINDGSSDGSGQIIEWFSRQDSRIRQIAHENNLGLVACLNEGVAAARGELIARLDSDDFWPDRDKLLKQERFLNFHPKVGLVGAWAEVVNAAGKHFYDFKPPATDAKIRRQMLRRNCFVHSGVLINKNLLMKAGGYRAEDRHVEDYALWLRLGRVAELANLPEIMVRYRISGGGVTQTRNSAQIRGALALIKAHRRNYPGYFFAALKWNLQALGLGGLMRRLKNRRFLL